MSHNNAPVRVTLSVDIIISISLLVIALIFAIGSSTSAIIQAVDRNTAACAER